MESEANRDQTVWSCVGSGEEFISGKEGNVLNVIYI